MSSTARTYRVEHGSVDDPPLSAGACDGISRARVSRGCRAAYGSMIAFGTFYDLVISLDDEPLPQPR
jgi:hypothetical protein